jgi:RNA polymerase sigma factor (sigma-70 family)
VKAVAQNVVGMTNSADTKQGADRGLMALVGAARSGDDRAWAELIERFDPMLRRGVSTFRLSTADVDDVVQGTWTKLYVHIDRIREPAAIPGWLMTTARRHALELLQVHTRELLTEEPERRAVTYETPESILLEAERRDAFVRAVSTLPERQRRVVALLAARPALEYEQVGSILKMPIGSIGPTRARGLANLERDAELRALVAA